MNFSKKTRGKLSPLNWDMQQLQRVSQLQVFWGNGRLGISFDKGLVLDFIFMRYFK